MPVKFLLQAVRLQAFWLLLPAAGTALAQQSDHPLLGGFPDSEISDYRTMPEVNYRVVLGSLQSVRGQVTPEASERLRGRLTRILYEISDGFTGQDVIDFFVEQMRFRGYNELFSCAGRACGSSEYWANDIFGNRILYGPVSNQFYLAMGSEPPGRFFISAYVITRINRQLLAWVEIIEPEGGRDAAVSGATPQSMRDQLRSNGGLIVPDLSFTAADELESGMNLDNIIGLLNLDPQLRLHIVSHLRGEAGLEQLLSRSQTRAESIRQRLVAAGIDPSRLSARGLGPLSPLCAADDCSERVELVAQSMP